MGCALQKKPVARAVIKVPTSKQAPRSKFATFRQQLTSQQGEIEAIADIVEMEMKTFDAGFFNVSSPIRSSVGGLSSFLVDYCLS